MSHAMLPASTIVKGRAYMNTEAVKLNRAIKTLDGVIDDLRAANLLESIPLLNIAKLDLAMRAHGLSESDLDGFLTGMRSLADAVAMDENLPAQPSRRRRTQALGSC